LTWPPAPQIIRFEHAHIEAVGVGYSPAGRVRAVRGDAHRVTVIRQPDGPLSSP
jgi:hypothetical protein